METTGRKIGPEAMNLIMITQRVGTSDPALAFIPTWIRHLALRLERLWVVTPRAEAVTLPPNTAVFQVGRDHQKRESAFHALGNFHHTLYDLIRTQPVDGVFAHMLPKYAILAAPYARLSRTPLALWYAHRNVSWQLRLAELLVGRILTTAPETCQLRSSKVLPIGQGIDTEAFRRKPPPPVPGKEGQTIVTVGRISPVKNLETVIEAAHILVCQRGHQKLQFVIVGEAPNTRQLPYQEYLVSLVNRKGLSRHVTFAGGIPHAQTPDLLQRSDAFVSASNSGMDKAVLEAMASEVPACVSDPVFRPILGPNADDLMFRPRDPVSLADRLAMLLAKSPEQRQAIGRDLRAGVKASHNVEALADKIVGVFEEMKGTVRGPAGEAPETLDT